VSFQIFRCDALVAPGQVGNLDDAFLCGEQVDSLGNPLGGN